MRSFRRCECGSPIGKGGPFYKRASFVCTRTLRYLPKSDGHDRPWPPKVNPKRYLGIWGVGTCATDGAGPLQVVSLDNPRVLAFFCFP